MMTRRGISGLLGAVAVFAALTGCTTTVDGTAAKEGSGGGPSNNKSEKTYPNLLKECDVLTTDILAKTVGADPLDIQSTFVGAVCRWQAANPAGLVDITRFWYEQGSLDNERQTAEKLQYAIEQRRIAGVDSIIMRPNGLNGACGVASDAAGVVGWWVNPQGPGIDACPMATKLMELTLATNS
ncbi:LprC protein [Mycolicibacterium vulneris]|nr:LprC protein [Mycolicibacterium vulneris]